MKKQAYVRILIGDLVTACVALGESQIVAAGSMYATFWFDDYEADTERLSNAGVPWWFDSPVGK